MFMNIQPTSSSQPLTWNWAKWMDLNWLGFCFPLLGKLLKRLQARVEVNQRGQWRPLPLLFIGGHQGFDNLWGNRFTLFDTISIVWVWGNLMTGFFQVGSRDMADTLYIVLLCNRDTLDHTYWRVECHWRCWNQLDLRVWLCCWISGVFPVLWD